MRRARTRPAVVVCALVLASAAWAQAPVIIVNDQPLATSRPVLERCGTVLLPMRDVFQALQATVTWYALERKIEARRGDTLLELWVGTPVAMANHNPLQLAVPPLMVNEVTYVPLRLPAEAFGGTVQWEPETRTVRLTLGP